MTKHMRGSKKNKSRSTNWWLIAGVMGVAVLLVAMLALASQRPETNTLAQYCQQNPGNCLAEGAEDAPVTVVEVSDYGCPHCADFSAGTAVQIHDQYVQTGQVKWVVLPFALTNQAGEAPTMDTAVSTMCAAEQGRFPEYHQAAFSLLGTPLFNSETGFMRTAEVIGLDAGAFAACLADNDYETIIRQNIRAATNAGVNATPSFAIGEHLLRGGQPFAVFQQRIESLLDS